MPYRDPEKQREYQRRWVAQRRADYLADKCCVDCGGKVDLEIDHVDASEKVTHRVWSLSKARRDAELEKCVVRCHVCHVAKSKQFDWKPRWHGSLAEYDHHGCRCEPCKAAKRVANAKRTLKKCA